MATATDDETLMRARRSLCALAGRFGVLDAHPRKAVLMRVAAGLSDDEIARVLGITPAAARRAVHEGELALE